MEIIDHIHHHIAIHTQADARWSYTDPPLATIPPDLRDIYMPSEGWPWLSWDWDQIELRIQAAYAGDEPMLQAFAKGWDVHLLAACDIFGWPRPPQPTDPFHKGYMENKAWLEEHGFQPCNHPHECAKDDRRRHFGKTAQHRLCKGGLAKNAGNIPGAKVIGIMGQAAVQAANAWLAAHPAIVQYHRRTIEGKNRTGETRTWAGRRRKYMHAGSSSDNECLAHPDQAGTQDIANLTIIEISRTYGVLGGKDWCYYVYGNHDSQNWAIREERWEEVSAGIRRIAQQPRVIGGRMVEFPASFKERR